MKFMLLLGLIGHIFCGASDWLLTYAPNGKVNLMDFKDYEKSSVSFRGMPLKNLTIAMILGVAAMTLELFGYMQLCEYVRDYSIVYYRIMYASALVMFISLPLHHIICCACEWFFVRQGLTKDALDSVWDFFKCTVYTMYIGYLAMLVFAVAFLIVVVTGKTGHAKMGMYLQSASVSCRHIADEASCEGKCNRCRDVPRTLVFDVRSC